MTSIAPKFCTPILEEDLYPSSDGQPLGETGIHVRSLLLLYQCLDEHFEKDPNILITCDLFWYWEKGNITKVCAPDIMFVRGVPKGDRKTFLGWKEKVSTPQTVFEVVSENKWRNDLTDKKELYERLGVKEYYLFDPTGEWLPSPLLGFRMKKKKYSALKPGKDSRLYSKEMDLYLQAENEFLRCIDAKTGKKNLHPHGRSETKRLALKAGKKASQKRKAAGRPRKTTSRSVSSRVGSIKIIPKEIQVIVNPASY